MSNKLSINMQNRLNKTYCKYQFICGTTNFSGFSDNVRAARVGFWMWSSEKQTSDLRVNLIWYRKASAATGHHGVCCGKSKSWGDWKLRCCFSVNMPKIEKRWNSKSRATKSTKEGENLINFDPLISADVTWVNNCLGRASPCRHQYWVKE